MAPDASAAMSLMAAKSDPEEYADFWDLNRAVSVSFMFFLLLSLLGICDTIDYSRFSSEFLPRTNLEPVVLDPPIDFLSLLPILCREIEYESSVKALSDTSFFGCCAGANS